MKKPKIKPTKNQQETKRLMKNLLKSGKNPCHDYETTNYSRVLAKEPASMAY
jgi:hypothetical protein